ncbi:MAG: cell division protein ZipA [Ketobacteraceae bacterium]|nr:cell division protein ZipA [Ketobacteraceae bacterium]
MEFGLREVLIGVGLLVIAGILFDGFRRMRRSRTGSLDMSSEMGGSMDDDWAYYKGELPNGGARKIQLGRKEPEFDDTDIEASGVDAPGGKEPDLSDELTDADFDMNEPMVADASDRIEPRRSVRSQETAKKPRRVVEPDPFKEPGKEEAATEDADTVQDYVTRSLTDDAADPGNNNYREEQADLFSDDEMLERAKQEQERKLASHYRSKTEPARGKARKAAPRQEPAAPAPEKESIESDIDRGVNEIADVLVINVMAKPGKEIQGEDLYRAMNSCGFRHGDMNIFHRYEQHNGGGRRLFSIANVVEPGTFEPTAPEDFSTPGICMFLKLPGPKRPLQAFDVMMDCGRKISTLLGTDMKDEHHSVMTQQTFEHYRQRVIDFERKQLSQRAVTR